MPFHQFEATDEQTRSQFGSPISPGRRRHLGPELDAPIVGTYVTIEAAPGEYDAPLADAPVLDFIAESLPRGPRGLFATDVAALERRMACVQSLPALALPSAHPCTELDQRRCVLEMRAREIIEGLAVTPEFAAEHGGIPLEIAQRVAADPRGAIYAWGERGRELDAEAEAQAHREREAAERAEQAARVAAEPNDRTCAELGVIAVRVPLDSDMIPRWLRAGNALRGGHHHVHDGYRYWLIRASSLFGLALPSSIPRTHAEVMALDHVPACTKGDLSWKPKAVAMPTGEGSGYLRTLLVQEQALDPARFQEVQELDLAALEMALATRKADRSPISQFHDERTPEGRHRKALFVERVRPVASRLGQRLVRHLAVQVGVRGLRLRPDVVRAELAKMAEAADVAPHVALEFVDGMAAEAVSGKSALVSPDECFTNPPPGALERIAIAMGFDPWRTTLKRAVVGRAFIRSEELESALVADGKIDGPLPPKGHPRLIDAMAKEGWEKRQGTIEGKVVRAYFPASAEG